MRHLFSTALRNREFSLLKVGEKIATIQLLHDNVDVVLILENVKQTDDMRVLAHLKNFNLTTLKFNVLD